MKKMKINLILSWNLDEERQIFSHMKKQQCWQRKRQ